MSNELETLLQQAKEQAETYAVVNDELVIDGETREINVPQSEMLFGVEGDVDIERKYFRCPKIVGDNIDLSKHLIYVAYVYTENQNNSFLPEIGVQSYLCTDVQAEGDDITFSWKLSGNVFKNPGFIAFKVFAKEKEESPLTVFNTTPAFGIVKMTIPDGNKEIAEKYPDVINQIFDRLDALESGGGGGTGGTTNYNNLSNKPQLNGVTLEGNKTLDQVGVLAKNQGASNSGKYLSVGSDGNVVPADAPSGGGGGSGTPGKDGREIQIQNNGTAIQWRYVGDESWTDLVQLSEITGSTGPQGEQGPKGETGSQGQTGPQGPKGDPGTTPNIQIGAVQTLEPEEQATASISGTPENPQLNLGIPKGQSGTADIPRREMQSANTNVTLQPNVLYVFPEMASLTVTLAEPSNTDVVNEWHFFFTSGTNPTTLTLNDVLADAYSIEANMKYEVSILEGVAYIKGVSTDEA